ncbi:CapA family protein [Pseudoalteromonas aurantia]|uniref:Capsule synthesis protein CapA domain-containing protein n=1 Tax=Pseudoalteromonas aurantia 208 TaxID=1314867 RepID=A0ABR9EHN2_9GAMM|nr:CapA family protein [Pseudoalteromonas aurantia]MBE0369258.1 hypothetical protein [Pseudoalteromonas aurantia 208]
MKSYILIAGDFVPNDTGNYNDTDSLYCKTLTAEINGADHFIVNLEAPVTKSSKLVHKSGPNLKLDNLSVGDLNSFGITDAKLANNHMMDFGIQGLKDTIEFCEKSAIRHCGAGLNQNSAKRALELKLEDKSVALINICENEFGAVDGDVGGVSGYDLPSLIRQLKLAKSQFDFVIIAFHCGVEHLAIPRPRLVNECRLLAELGADLIVCHHTHTPSAYEVHDGCQIFYGIGNFYFPGNKHDFKWNRGLLVKVSITDEGRLDGELLYTKQSSEKYCVEILNTIEEKELTGFLEKQNECLTSVDVLNDKWMKYCSEVENEFLTLVYFPFIAWPMRILSRFSLFKRIAFPLFRVAVRKNLITCESHYEVLQSIHANYYKKRQASKNEK